MPIKTLGLCLILCLAVLIYLVINQPVSWLNNKNSNSTGLNTTINSPTVTPVIIPTITIDSIFDQYHSTIDNLPDKDVVTIIATGDVMTARNVNKKALQYKNFLWPFEKTVQTLKEADLTFINLETTLFDSCPTSTEQFTFCGEDDNIQGLLSAGVDVASIANNHTLNFGQEGLVKTMNVLNQAGIQPVGLDTDPVYLQSKGVKLAFLGFNQVGVIFNEKIYRNKISEAKLNADIVIVGIHFGIEYVSQPTEEQIKLAHLGIDSGADLIIGNHPHWIQPMEIYKGKFITYAHGNFVFDQMWSQKTREGVVGKYYFYNNKLVDIEFIPVLIEDYGQPRLLDGGYKQAILDQMKQESLILSQKLLNKTI